jgi:outer membrane protein assembly factor BamB
VVALEPESGAVKWERELSRPGREFRDVDTSPVVDEQGRVLVASYKDGMFALEGDTGDVLWNTTTAGITGQVVRGEVVFATGDRAVTAFHSEDGQILWTLPLPGRAAQPPTLARGTLVAPVNDALLFVDPSTGRKRLMWDPGQGVSATPVWAHQRLYVLSNNGYLYALRLEKRG